jgi:hypothetical protein
VSIEGRAKTRAAAHISASFWFCPRQPADPARAACAHGEAKGRGFVVRAPAFFSGTSLAHPFLALERNHGALL